MKLFDSHAHYNDEKFEEDREKILQQIQEEGIEKVINAGYSIQASRKSIELANTHSFLYATVGISPNDIPEKLEETKKQLEEIKQLANQKKVVAIGEIGLDYYWNKENKPIQKETFQKQIQIADEVNLPIVIHTREAIIDTIEILKKSTPKEKGVFHCCPLNPELVKEGLKLGFYISFAGPVTFKNAKHAEEIIKLVPFDRMLIETDSPYLCPEPHRGKRNDSRNVRYIAEKIAQVKNISSEEIAKITYQNACKLFKL